MRIAKVGADVSVAYTSSVTGGCCRVVVYRSTPRAPRVASESGTLYHYAYPPPGWEEGWVKGRVCELVNRAESGELRHRDGELALSVAELGLRLFALGTGEPRDLILQAANR